MTPFVPHAVHKMVGKNWEAVIEAACRNARQLRAQKEELREERYVEVLTSEGDSKTRKAETDDLEGIERAHKKHRASTTVRIGVKSTFLFAMFLTYFTSHRSTARSTATCRRAACARSARRRTEFVAVIASKSRSGWWERVVVRRGRVLLRCSN